MDYLQKDFGAPVSILLILSLRIELGEGRYDCHVLSLHRTIQFVFVVKSYQLDYRLS